MTKYKNQFVKVRRKIIRTWLCITFHLIFINCAFENFNPFNNNKQRLLLFIWFVRNTCFFKFRSFFRTYNQISYSIVSFPKVIRHDCLFLACFLKKYQHLNPVGRFHKKYKDFDTGYLLFKKSKTNFCNYYLKSNIIKNT